MSKPERGTAPESYADDLREAFASLGGGGDDTDDDASSPLKPRAEAPKEAPEPDPEVDASEPDGSQESKYGDPETAPSIAPEIEAREAKAREAAQTVQPPEHWSLEDKTKFAGLADDAARQAVLDWRTQIEKGAQEKFDAAAEARKFSEEVGRLMQPFDAELQRAGMSRVDGIKRLVAAEQLLRQRPQEGLQWLLDQYGGGQYAIVRKGQQSPAQQAQSGQPQGNGNGHAQFNETQIAQLVDQRLQGIFAAQQQQEYERQLREAEKSLQEFAEAKAEDGRPLRPHFDAVKAHMGVLMQVGAASTLEEAYDQAIWSQPALRTEVMKAQTEAAQKAAAEAHRQAVAKAKAARTPKTASVAVPPADEDEDLPQTEVLRKVWRQQQAGGTR